MPPQQPLRPSAKPVRESLSACHDQIPRARHYSRATGCPRHKAAEGELNLRQAGAAVGQVRLDLRFFLRESRCSK